MLTATPSRSTPIRRGPTAHDYIEAITGVTAPALPPPGLLTSVGPAGYFGPATVNEFNESERRVLVQWEQSGQSRQVWARHTLPPGTQLKAGDVVLALGQNTAEVYVIGLLSESPRNEPPTPTLLQTQSGATAGVTRAAGKEVVQIHSRQGALVVEYDPESGKTLVNVENGDLEFATQNGSIVLNSAKKISLVAHRLETEADTVVSKAANVYASVEELNQLQAGRTRTLVKGSCHLQARDAFLNATEDFKIDGKQIHLG